MKRTIFIILLCFAWNLSSAPGRAELVILTSESINPYERIWEAICEHETSNDSTAYNEIEQAVGIAQIRPIRLKDYNIRSGNRYRLEEMYEVNKSKAVFMFYAQKIHNTDRIIRLWNGRGPTNLRIFEKS